MSTKILYTVLNWGLGHASRSIPIIQYLISLDLQIVIASDGEALVLLKKEFPNLEFEALVSYNINYSKDAKNFDKTIFLQLNKLGNAIKKEHQQTQELIVKNNITHIISDNRYGCFSKEIPSTIICHQITLQHKFGIVQKQINMIHRKLLNKFTEVWVPDYNNENTIAKNISHLKQTKFFLKNQSQQLASKLKYIGPLSRMKLYETKQVFDLCIILSGPEPQRTILEEILLKEIKKNTYKTVLIRGTKNTKNTISENQHLCVFDLLKTDELEEKINQSKTILCRAGYSSIMDMIQLKKTAILVPTPGQTEQEYLAKILDEKKWFPRLVQGELNLEKAILKCNQYQIPIRKKQLNLLPKIVIPFLELL